MQNTHTTPTDTPAARDPLDPIFAAVCRALYVPVPREVRTGEMVEITADAQFHAAAYRYHQSRVVDEPGLTREETDAALFGVIEDVVSGLIGEVAAGKRNALTDAADAALDQYGHIHAAMQGETPVSFEARRAAGHVERARQGKPMGLRISEVAA